MKKLLSIATTILFSILTHVSNAQNATQTIKGAVTEKSINGPLVGANVIILNTNPVKGGTADDNGRFKITDVPIGKYTIKVTYVGFKDVVLNNILVNAGKELDLNIQMEENAFQGDEVVIRAKIEKQKALNELSTISTRTFSVEETQRFAAAVNDPARMATAYAGVVSGGDGGNAIVIRGNSPNGLLWRMEGVDIPNPNHFSTVGSTAGGISILSAQLLTNSDFSTGAFAAEYGNALSGVFDLKLRKGNAEKREYTAQIGLLGLDIASEGPLSMKNKKGSYLVNYRYSTLGLLSNLGVNIGGGGVSTFQDLSFNVSLPTEKMGNFTLFGFGGLSTQNGAGKADSAEWKTDYQQKFGFDFTSNTGAIGLTHSLIFKKSYLKTVFSASSTQNKGSANEILNDYSRRTTTLEDFVQQKYTLSSVYTHKFNAKSLLRTGAYVNFLGFNFAQSGWNPDVKKLLQDIKADGNTSTINVFGQWQYHPVEALTLNAGLHIFRLNLNGKTSFEPRLSAKYALNERQSFSLGYGLHSQMQPLGVYFYQTKKDNTLIDYRPNENLDFTKAHHFVLSYDQVFEGNWHFKAETYYQNLFSVPLSKSDNNTLSALNLQFGFTPEIFENKGNGRNYGIEFTVEKFLTNGFYMLLSTSIFDSKYQALDGKWYNTRYNTSIANSLLVGKEWGLRKNRTLGLNLKFTHIGGQRATPLDLAASKKEERSVFDFTKNFSTQFPYYLRADVGVRLIRDYKKITTTLSLNVQNATNRENIFNDYYDVARKEIRFNNQAPLIPVLAYKVEF